MTTKAIGAKLEAMRAQGLSVEGPATGAGKRVGHGRVGVA
jgi:hypothetical protein